MMPGIGLTEMILLVVVAIIVIGPKDLPLMMRKFGQFTGKMRALAFEFQQGMDELGRQAELEELRKEVADLKKHTGLDELQSDLEKDHAAISQDLNAAAQLPPPEDPAAFTAALSESANGHDAMNGATAEGVAAALPSAETFPESNPQDHFAANGSDDFKLDPDQPVPAKQEHPA